MHKPEEELLDQGIKPNTILSDFIHWKRLRLKVMRAIEFPIDVKEFNDNMELSFRI